MKAFLCKVFFPSLKLMYFAGLVNCEGHCELNNLGSSNSALTVILNIPILDLLLLIKRDNELFSSFEFDVMF